MAALQIQPHSRRVSHLAVAGLALLAAGAFTVGVTRQIRPAGPSPFPPAQQPTVRVAAEIPEAAPAPDMQLAAAPPPHRHATRTVAQETPPPDAANAPSADTPPGVDAAANAPAQPDPSAPPPAFNPTPATQPGSRPEDSDTPPPI